MTPATNAHLVSTGIVHTALSAHKIMRVQMAKKSNVEQEKSQTKKMAQMTAFLAITAGTSRRAKRGAASAVMGNIKIVSDRQLASNVLSQALSRRQAVGSVNNAFQDNTAPNLMTITIAKRKPILWEVPLSAQNAHLVTRAPIKKNLNHADLADIQIAITSASNAVRFSTKINSYKVLASSAQLAISAETKRWHQ